MRILEKRRAPRIHYGMKLEMTGEKDAFGARCLNVSSSGILMDAGQRVDPGSVLTLKFKTQLASVPEATARVVRCQPAFWGRRHVVAVEFDEANRALMDIVTAEHNLHEQAGL